MEKKQFTWRRNRRNIIFLISSSGAGNSKETTTIRSWEKMVTQKAHLDESKYMRDAMWEKGRPEPRQGFARRDWVHPRARRCGGITGMLRKIRSDFAGARTPWWITEATTKLITALRKNPKTIRVCVCVWPLLIGDDRWKRWRLKILLLSDLLDLVRKYNT